MAAPTICIALLRGINVGRARRIAMADLRSAVEALGHVSVRTLLNSGNVVFAASRGDVAAIAAELEHAIAARFGFSTAVSVVTLSTLDAIVAGNTLPQCSDEPARFLVAFGLEGAVLAKAKPLAAQAWSPEALAIGKDAAYLWCADGILASKLAAAFGRATGTATTARNWSTVLKLQAAAQAIAHVG